MRVVGSGNITIVDTSRRPVRCIAILSAMTSELRPVQRALGVAGTSRKGERFYAGVYKDVEVITAATSIGLAAAQSATEALFARYGDTIDHLFVVGVAGAYDLQLKVGEVVIPKSVIDQRDGVVRYPANLSTVEPAGVIYSSDALSYSEDYIATLNSKNVTAVDRESGAITAVCQRHGCPVTIVRAISGEMDIHAEPYDIFHLADIDGSPKYREALRFVLRRPQRIAYLLALAFGARKAIRAATAELLLNIDTLIERGCQYEEPRTARAHASI